ncbi:MAG: protein translocase subunit SecF [Oscillospiraceae bacterium]|nr:protein translocase subunit SecF [Oscillospiraceae bacterium]
MKKIKKPTFFIITAFVLLFSYLTVFGISTYYGDNRTIWIKSVNDIRWGIDIRGGVDVTFTPPPDYEGEVTDVEIDAARSTIETRMISKNITDYEIYSDYDSRRIIVRFPWQSGDTNFDPEEAVKELGEMAELTFWEGFERTEYGTPVLSGRDVRRATPFYDPGRSPGEQGQHGVSLELNESGTQAFSESTARLAQSQEVISIWMDDIMISSPTVNEHIGGGSAQITGNFTREEAVDLANKINGGALPFKVVTDSFNVIDPTMGMGARNAMAVAGIIAFVIMCVFMINRYKVLGVIATVGLTGQLFGALAVISGFFGAFDSFTLTIPGIAGIILSIGMGVDANVITAERIKEEIRSGKTLDGAVQAGYKRAFSAIFDGNITMIIVAFILMGAFGTPDSFASTMLNLVFRWFGPSAAGAIYAFGYTLIIGVILNFIFGVFGSRLMTYSLVKFKQLRNPTLYGGYKSDEQKAKAESAKIFDAVGNRKKFLIAPIVVVAVAISVMLVAGLEVAIEFRGGTILNYTYEGEIDADDVKNAVESQGAGTVNVRLGTAFGSELNTMTIEFSSQQGLTADVQHSLTQSLEGTFAENNLSTAGSQDVNPTMGRAFFLKCLVAVIFSFIVLMLYIALRFRNVGGWSSGFFAILALMINVAIVFAVFVFFRFPIDANFMAVVLTILCYSINDTIVVFDRIRENRSIHGKRISYSELVNKSVSQSLTRSLNTTITTSIAMATICIVALVTGIGSMLSFAFPLLIGLLFGFVTSLFMAGRPWAGWNSRGKY